MLLFTSSVCVSVCVISEVQDYQREILPPVTAQPSHHASVVASILEQHAAELSAAQEWDNEWNSQGLLSRLTPQVRALCVSAVLLTIRQWETCKKINLLSSTVSRYQLYY